MGLFGNGLFNTGSNDDGGYVRTQPPARNRHTLRAQKLDGKYERALGKGDLTRAASLRHKADNAARKGGWF